MNCTRKWQIQYRSNSVQENNFEDIVVKSLKVSLHEMQEFTNEHQSDNMASQKQLLDMLKKINEFMVLNSSRNGENIPPDKTIIVDEKVHANFGRFMILVPMVVLISAIVFSYLSPYSTVRLN